MGNGESHGTFMGQKLDISQEQLDHIKHAFAKYDKKSNGIIRPKHLVKVLRKLGLNPTEDQIFGFLNEILIDGKKKVEFTDVLHVATILSHDPDTLIIEVFKLFDKDGSGSITSEEFYDQMRRCGAPISEAEVAEIMRAVDTNGDGEIDLKELAFMLKEVVSDTAGGADIIP